MTNIIEHAARAAYESECRHFQMYGTWEKLDARVRYARIEAQRAAIEAMREPSEEMSFAGDKAGVEYWPCDPATFDAAEAWRAMIDVVLEE